MATELLKLSNSLDFAGVPNRLVVVISIERHAAEKLHAMCRDYGDRENTRFHDLVDLVILIERGLLQPAAVAGSAAQVWLERDGTPPPTVLPSLPESWHDRYQALAETHGIRATTLPAAVALVTELWTSMFHDEES